MNRDGMCGTWRPVACGIGVAVCATRCEDKAVVQRRGRAITLFMSILIV